MQENWEYKDAAENATFLTSVLPHTGLVKFGAVADVFHNTNHPFAQVKRKICIIFRDAGAWG